MATKLAAFVLTSLAIGSMRAQKGTVSFITSPPKYDLSVGYNYIRANAPPSECGCFNMNGGYVSGSAYVNRWLRVMGEGTVGYASNISDLGQNLSLFTLASGPRFSYTGHRFVPYAQTLIGIAHGSNSFFPHSTSFTTSANTYAFTAGAGVDYNINHRYAIRALQAQYLRTGFPNGTTDTQAQLMLSAGIIIKFHSPNVELPPPPSPRPIPISEISFTCSTDIPSIEEGQPLRVIGHAFTEPDKLSLAFAWSSTGGKVMGTGRQISLDTTNIAAGMYIVHGRATLIDDTSTTSECEVPFRVTKRITTAPQTFSEMPPDPNFLVKQDKDFHENVKDALFDYDSAVLRKDALQAVEEAAEYLRNHPEIGVQIQGYADERGSAEYNLALGEERASAARNALIAAGISERRLQIVSFGKESQLCTDNTETCWQQNRRAAFSMRH